MKEKSVDVQHRPAELLAMADGGRNERQMEKSLPTCLPLCDRERGVGGNGGCDFCTNSHARVRKMLLLWGFSLLKGWEELSVFLYLESQQVCVMMNPNRSDIRLPVVFLSAPWWSIFANESSFESSVKCSLCQSNCLKFIFMASWKKEKKSICGTFAANTCTDTRIETPATPPFPHTYDNKAKISVICAALIHHLVITSQRMCSCNHTSITRRDQLSIITPFPFL